MSSQEKVITNHQEAELAVYKWCMAQGLDPSRFTEITAELSKGLSERPIQESGLINYITHFSISTKQTEEYWNAFSRSSWAAASNWAIETVKHLAFVNGAALAGATALLNSAKAYPMNWLISAIILLGGGLLLALLCMWTETQGYQLRGEHFDDRATAIRSAKTWKAFVEAANKEYKDPGHKWFTASLIVGWMSAIAALAGVCCIVIAIAFSPATHDASEAIFNSALKNLEPSRTPSSSLRVEPTHEHEPSPSP